MKILYIAGLSHVGSTYLSRVLNNHSEVFVAGEIQNFDQSLDSEDDCVCTELSTKQKCEFWRSIKDELSQYDLTPRDVDRLACDRRKNWIKALGQYFSLWSQEDFQRGNRRLFELLQNRTGADVIVDNSKSPWRLLPLVMDEELSSSIKVLHLLKTPANQVASRMERGLNFWHSAFLKYFRKNYVIESFLSEMRSYRTLRMEHFVENYRSGIRTLQDWLELDEQPLFEKGPPDEFHHLRGNSSIAEQTSIEPKPERIHKDHDWGGGEETVLSFLRNKFYGDSQKPLLN